MSARRLSRAGFALACIGLVALIPAFLGYSVGFVGNALQSIDLNGILMESMVAAAVCALTVGIVAGILFGATVKSRIARVFIVGLNAAATTILSVVIVSGFIRMNMIDLVLDMTCDEDGVCVPAPPDLTWLWWTALAVVMLVVAVLIRILGESAGRPHFRALPTALLLVLSTLPFVNVAGMAGFVIVTSRGRRAVDPAEPKLEPEAQ